MRLPSRRLVRLVAWPALAVLFLAFVLRREHAEVWLWMPRIDAIQIDEAGASDTAGRTIELDGMRLVVPASVADGAVVEKVPSEWRDGWRVRTGETEYLIGGPYAGVPHEASIWPGLSATATHAQTMRAVYGFSTDDFSWWMSHPQLAEFRARLVAARDNRRAGVRRVVVSPPGEKDFVLYISRRRCSAEICDRRRNTFADVMVYRSPEESELPLAIVSSFEFGPRPPGAAPLAAD